MASVPSASLLEHHRFSVRSFIGCRWKEVLGVPRVFGNSPETVAWDQRIGLILASIATYGIYFNLHFYRKKQRFKTPYPILEPNFLEVLLSQLKQTSFYRVSITGRTDREQLLGVPPSRVDQPILLSDIDR